jgi:hypothetical protein
MYLRGEQKLKNSVGVSVWNKDGSKNKKGHYSTTFSVEDTTSDEVVELFKKAIRGQEL